MAGAGWPRVSLFAAYAWVVAVTLILRLLFADNPLPRFADLYLPAVALTAWWHSWRAAALLVLCCTLLSAYLLAPISSDDVFRMAAFVLSSTVIVGIIQAIKLKTAKRGSDKI